MKKIFPILFIMVLCSGNAGFAASVSIAPSDVYVIAGQHSVGFACEVILDESESTDAITFEIDYEGDGIIDDSSVVQSEDGVYAMHTFTHLYSTAGYWDTVVAVITNAERIVNDPVTINVAQWKFPASGTIGGIAATPAVGDDGSIYFGSGDGKMYALNPDGTLKWHYSNGGPVSSSAAIDSDGNIYFGSEDGNLYCRTPDNREKWPPFLTGDGVFGSPALSRDGKTVYIGSTDGCLYAIGTETGAPQWPLAFQTNAKIVSSPVVGFDGIIYIGSLDHHLYAVSPDGNRRWDIDLYAGIYGGIALDGDGTLYVGTSRFGGAKDSANKLFSISSTGKEKWQANVLSGFAAPPVIYGTGVILAGSYDNRLYAFDRNGENLWMFTHFSDDIVNSPAAGSNSLVYTASKDGMIYALIDDWDYLTSRELAWRYDMKMPVTTSSPVVANGSVYIGTYAREGGVLWAFAAESEEMAKSLEYAVAEADPKSPWPMMRNDSRNTGSTGFSPDTAATAVVETDPANGVDDFDVVRNSITATFSRPIDPDFLYTAPTEDSKGYYGFTVAPFEEASEEFEIKWISDVVVELVLPAGVSFEKDVIYTATIQTQTTGSSGDDADASPGLLYPHTWHFSYTTPEKENYSGGRGCFISCIQELNP